MLTLILFIFVLGIIVLVHEFGHFLFAKLFGIYVYEFSIGMGPKLFGFKGKNGETEYNIRAIPVGGFVQLAGEEVDDDKKVPRDRKLFAKPVWQRFLVMFFGAGFNFILALVILFGIGVICGAPSTSSKLTSVDKNLPAYKAGIEAGDTVIAINNHKIRTNDDLAIYLEMANKDKDIKFVVKKENGSEKSYEVRPEKVKDDEGNVSYKLGIGFGGTREYGFVSAVKFTFVKTGSLLRQMVITLKGLFTGGIGVGQLSGPVGIYSIVGSQAKQGIENIFYLIALLSINVGFINLVPFPAFDGGRILFLFIEKVKGSPVKPETENKIHTVGFFILMALMLYITFNDIFKLF